MYIPYEVKRPLEITEFFSAFEYSGDNTYAFEGERHNFWEILILKKGELRIMEDDRVYRLMENQIIFHKPMAFHTLKVESPYANYMVISFNVAGNYIERFENKVINLSKEQMNYINVISDMFANEGLDNSVMKITKFLKIMREKPVCYHKFASVVEFLLISLSESSMHNPQLVDNGETQLYKNAINALEANIYSNISVSELARECRVSTSQLKRVFSKYAGIGIHEYFLQLKILHAKKLLVSGMGVTEVAEKLSFSSQNYFSVVFKRKVGISPLKYKNSGK